MTADRFDLPGQRVVTMTLLVDAPLSAEPSALEGVATLAMRACDEGTVGHPAAALTEALEGCGAATIGAGARLDGAMLTVEAPATRLAEALPLVSELIREPAFEDGDVARLVDDALLGIATGEASPPVCATKAAYACFGDHRLARPAGGGAKTVAQLTQDALHSWHRAAVQPKRCRLIIAGDLPEDTDALIDDAFGSWRAVDGAATLPAAVPPPAAPRGRVVIVDHPDAAQASLRLATLVPSRPSQDWPALQVANAIVGGTFGSRLNQVLREQRGLTYGANSWLAPTRDVAVYMAQAECRVEAAAEAVELSLQLLDLAASPVTPDEVRDAAAYITGATPLRLDTAAAVAAQAADFALGAVAPDWFDDYMAALARVTPDDATAAFARHIRPSSLVVALCGPADVLAGQLQQAGHTVEVVAAAELVGLS